MINSYGGWVANLLLIVGTFLVGEKKRSAFLYIFVGEALWTYVGWLRSSWDIIVLGFVFAGLAGYNYWKWRLS